MVAETSFSPVKVTTEHKWFFNNWSLLYLYYDGLKSPKIKINGEDGGTCEISLNILPMSQHSQIRMNLSDITHFMAIFITTSFLDIQGHELWAAKAETCQCSSIVQIIPHMRNSNNMQTYLQNDTLIVHVKFTVLQSIAFSSYPIDVYSVNFAEIVRENSEALREFKRSSNITLFIGGKKLFVVNLILADKTKAFQWIFTGVETKKVEENTISLSDTKIKTFEEFCDYLEKGTMTMFEKIDDKFIDADKQKVYELKTFCKYYIGKTCNAGEVTPKTILNYLRVTYQLLCRVLKAQALHFMEVNGGTFSIPKNYKLFAKYITFIVNSNDSNK